MIKWSSFLLTLIASATFPCLFAQIPTHDCPFHMDYAPTNEGWEPDVVVRVYVNSSWTDMIPSVDQVLAAWNSASGAAGTNVTFVRVSQPVTGPNTMTVIQSPTAGTRAQVTLSPGTTYLDAAVVELDDCIASPDAFKNALSHEIGHTFRLGHAGDETTQSTMTGYNGICNESVNGLPEPGRCDSYTEYKAYHEGEDTDGDGRPNNQDNCYLDPNPSQENLDGDELGDICDPDKDGDGYVAGYDDCNDRDLNVNRYATEEECNYHDENCDGLDYSMTHRDWCVYTLRWCWYPASCDCAPCPPSPIIVDADRGGISLTDVGHGVRFDLNSDGSPELLPWTAVDSGDAFLVLDRDKSGMIENGRELFGDLTEQPTSDTPNGFAALAVFDSAELGGNQDGLITPDDAVYLTLRLWTDRNHDGISQPFELRSLSSYGISAIELAYKEARHTDRYGNMFRYRAKVHSNQATTYAYDVFFNIDTTTPEDLNPDDRGSLRQSWGAIEFLYKHGRAVSIRRVDIRDLSFPDHEH